MRNISIPHIIQNQIRQEINKVLRKIDTINSKIEKNSLGLYNIGQENISKKLETAILPALFSLF